MTFPKPARAVWFALLVVVLVRLGLGLASEALFLIPENDFDKLYLMNETRYRLSDQPPPKLIVMGTSRLGILKPESLAAEAGVQPEEVANYSLAGNSYWRTLAFFRRNPAMLGHAKAVVIDLLPYQLYRGRLFTEEDELFLRLATFEERLAVEHPVSRLKAVTDWLVPVWSERHNPDGWRQGIHLLGLDPPSRYRAFREAVERSGHLDLRQEAHEAPAAANPEMGRGYAPEPVVSPVQVKALEDLRKLLPPDCVLLLAWLPVREDFVAALGADPEMRASYETFRAFVTGLDLPATRVVWLDNTAGRYLPESDFTDVVHYTDEGIRKIDGLLAEALDAATPPAVPSRR